MQRRHELLIFVCFQNVIMVVYLFITVSTRPRSLQLSFQLWPGNRISWSISYPLVTLSEDPHLQKAKWSCNETVLRPQGFCAAIFLMRKEGFRQRLPFPTKGYSKKYSKAKHCIKNPKGKWWRHVHLLCRLELRNQLCIEGKWSCKLLEKLYVKVTQLLDCSWGIVFYTNQTRL